ncbi:hypothetical protein [Rhizobium sp. MHM7A]|uniref:hypothetical protein n=1 Tax=Rhizobium sp. MHM7A TaxID=2583233 RepID=UPI0011061849|nr:hypothetical protein [Rhizobium sp. MHM7A]TLX16113.1 hypothetical protein FFR93_01970 [Rhizobium sp. MHM7A]
MNNSSTAVNLVTASWGRIAQAIKETVEANPWDRLPTVFLETFQAQCKREGELMIADGTVFDIFPKTKPSDLLDANFPAKLFKKIEKLHGAEKDELLMSYLFTVDREGLEGEVASTISDALSVLHALHSKWTGEGSYSAPQIAYTLWHLDDELDELLPDVAQLVYAHLSSIRAYYDHSKGEKQAEEIWIKHSISKKPGLMARMETLGQLARTEPKPVIEAFLKERISVDISVLEAIALADAAKPEEESGPSPG